MIHSRRASLIVAAILCLSPAFLGDGRAQTKVDISGKHITITVPIDGIGIDEKTAKEWKQSAESIWNAAFDSAQDNPFKSCFTLKLIVDVQAHDYTFKAQAGRHLIFSTNSATSSQSQGSITRLGSGPGDYLDPYDRAEDGNFDESFNTPDSNRVAHEVGHLLGLRDDYTVTGSNPRKTTPIGGRGNTLMADGGPVDPVLIRRLTNLLRQKTHEVPDCKWTGILKVRGAGNLYDDTGSMEFAFSVTPDDTVIGKGKAISSNTPHFFGSCTYTATRTPTESDVDIGGKLDGDEFRLELISRTKVSLQITTSCKGKSSVVSPIFPLRGMAGALGEGGATPTVEFLKVRAEDGSTNSWHENNGAVEMTGSIELHRAETPQADCPSC